MTCVIKDLLCYKVAFLRSIEYIFGSDMVYIRQIAQQSGLGSGSNNFFCCPRNTGCRRIGFNATLLTASAKTPVTGVVDLAVT